MEQQLIGYAEASRLLGIKKATLYSLVSRKRVPHVRLGRRLVRFSVAQLHAWWSQHTVEATRHEQNGKIAGSTGRR